MSSSPYSRPASGSGSSLRRSSTAWTSLSTASMVTLSNSSPPTTKTAVVAAGYRTRPDGPNRVPEGSTLRDFRHLVQCGLRETGRAGMEQRLLAQDTGLNRVINVYTDRVEIRTGWQSQNTNSLGLKQVAHVSIRGLVNCTLAIEVNDGRRLHIERMALPDARRVKAAIDSQKKKAGLYE